MPLNVADRGDQRAANASAVSFIFAASEIADVTALGVLHTRWRGDELELELGRPELDSHAPAHGRVTDTAFGFVRYARLAQASSENGVSLNPATTRFPSVAIPSCISRRAAPLTSVRLQSAKVSGRLMLSSDLRSAATAYSAATNAAASHQHRA